MSNNEEQTITAARKATLTQLIALGAKSRQHLIVNIALAGYTAEHVLCDNIHLQELLADAVMLIVAQRRELEQVRAGDRETAVAA